MSTMAISIHELISNYVENDDLNSPPRLHSDQLSDIREIIQSDSDNILNDNFIETLATLLSGEILSASIEAKAMSIATAYSSWKSSDESNEGTVTDRIEHCIQACVCISLLLAREARRGSLLCSTLFSEECLEQCIVAVTKCLTSNFSVVSSTTAMSPVKGRKRKQENLEVVNTEAGEEEDDKTQVPKKVMTDAIRRLFPLMHCFVWSLRTALCSHRQTDRVCVCLCELGFSLLRSNLYDPSSNTAGSKKRSEPHSLLVSGSGLAEGGIAVLCDVFRHSTTQRPMLMQEVYSFLRLVYTSPKSYPRVITLPLHLSSHGGGMFKYVKRCKVTAAGALVVCLVQCVVGGDEDLVLPVMPEDGLGIDGRQALLKDIYTRYMKDPNAVANTVMSGMLTRCRHRETGSDYREALNQLVAEVLECHVHQHSPGATILLSAFLRRCTADISSLTSSSPTNTADTKSDTSFVNFLVDVMGGLGARVREVEVVAKREADAARCAVVPTGISTALSKQYETLCPIVDRIQLHTQESSNTTTESPSGKSNKKRKQSKGKCKKQHTVPLQPLSVSAVRDVLSLYRDLAGSALDLLCDGAVDPEIAHSNSCEGPPNGIARSLSATIVDNSPLVLTSPALSAPPSTPRTTTPAVNFPQNPLPVTQSIALPSFATLLSEAGAPEDVKNSLESYVSVMDLYNWCLIDGMVVLAGEDSSSAINPFLYGAAELLTVMWMMDTVNRDNIAVGELALGILRYLSGTRRGTNTASSLSSILSLAVGRGDGAGGDTIYTPEWGMVSYRAVLFEDRCLSKDFSLVLRLLLLLFSQPSPLVRSRVVRALACLVAADPSLLSSPELQECVIERFNDVSISVREETVKLVGGYMLGQHHHQHQRDGGEGMSMDGYLNGLLVRLRDKGVSVRKSVVTILRSILLHQPNHPRYSEVCKALLERCWLPKEEDTLKDVIRLTFQQIWFNPAPSEAVRAAAMWRSASSVNLTTSLVREGSPSSATVITDTATADVIAENAKDGTLQIDVECGGEGEEFSGRDTTVATPEGQGHENATQYHAETTAAQIVDVVASSSLQGGGGREDQWLVQMLREMLHGSNAASEVTAQAKKRRACARLHCCRLVECLIELLMRAEERLAVTLNGNPGNDAEKSCTSMTPQEEIVAIFVTLACFCKAHPPYVIRHLHLLIPYLAGDNGLSNQQQESIVCLKVTQMLSEAFLVSPNGSEPDECLQQGLWENKAEEIGQDLTRVALTYSGPNIQAAVECLGRLATNILHHARHLTDLADKCFRAIAAVSTSCTDMEVPSYETTYSLPQAEMAKLQRCIVVLGYICEQSSQCPMLLCSADGDEVDDRYDEDIARKELTGPGGLSFLPGGALNGATYVCVKYCLRVANAAVRSRAVQALCSIFVGRPTLMLFAEETGLLRRILLGQAYGDLVLDRMLQALRHVLLMEESRLEHGAAVDQMRLAGTSLGSKVQGADVAAENTITGSVLQQHLSILSRLPVDHSDPGIRLSSLELLGTLLNHGMVHPLDILSLLVALQGDEEPLIRQRALALLIEQDERRSSFLDNRLIEGMETACDMQLRRLGHIYPFLSSADPEGEILCSPDDLSVVCPSSVFSSLYTACVRPYRKRRMDVICGILRKCESHYQTLASLRSAWEKCDVSSPMSPSVSRSRNKTGSETKRPGAFSTDRDADKLLLDLIAASSALSRIRFLVCVLAKLPFSVQDEPLMAVYWINRNVPVGAGIFQKHMQLVLSTAGAEKEGLNVSGVVAKNSVSTHHEEDMLCVRADSFNQRRAATNNSNNDGLLVLYSLECRGRETLLRLKSFLKAAYGLSDERCLAFSPSEDVGVATSGGFRVGSVSDRDRERHRDSIFSVSTGSKASEDILMSWSQAECCSPLTDKRALNLLQTCVEDHNRLCSMLDGDVADDFTLVPSRKSSSINRPKRKRDVQTSSPGKKRRGRKAGDVGIEVSIPTRTASARKKVKTKRLGESVEIDAVGEEGEFNAVSADDSSSSEYKM